jgi:hypothetical protein
MLLYVRNRENKEHRITRSWYDKSSISYISPVFPSHAMQAERESRGTAPLILNPSSR